MLTPGMPPESQKAGTTCLSAGNHPPLPPGPICRGALNWGVTLGGQDEVSSRIGTGTCLLDRHPRDIMAS